MPLAAEAVDGVGPQGALEVHHVAHADSADTFLGRGHSQPGHGLAFVAGAAVGPQPHIVLLVELLVLADRQAADEHVGRGGNRVDGNAQLRRTLAVGLNPQLRLAERQARIDVHEILLIAHPADDALRILLQLVHVRSAEIQVHHHLAEAGPLEGRDILHGRAQVGVILEDQPRLVHDGKLRVFALPKIGEPAVDRCLSHVALPLGDAASRVADDRESVRHAAQRFQAMFQLGARLVGPFK